MTSWSSVLGGRSSPGECRESQAGVPACESVVTVSPGAGVTLGFLSLDLLVFSHLWGERNQVAILIGLFEQVGG